jgi:hypothetical protein
MAELRLSPTKITLAFKSLLACYICLIVTSSPAGCDKLNWIQLLLSLVIAEIAFTALVLLVPSLTRLMQAAATVALLSQFGWHCTLLYWQYTGSEFIPCKDIALGVKALQTVWLGSTLFAVVFMLRYISSK